MACVVLHVCCEVTSVGYLGHGSDPEQSPSSNFMQWLSHRQACRLATVDRQAVAGSNLMEPGDETMVSLIVSCINGSYRGMLAMHGSDRH